MNRPHPTANAALIVLAFFGSALARRCAHTRREYPRPEGASSARPGTGGRGRGRWQEGGSFEADGASPKPKTYVLELFPYPPGRMHVGQARNYARGEVLAGSRRMQ